MNKRIIVLSGGFSKEREVSLVSAGEIAASLTKSGFDAVLLDPSDFNSYVDLVMEVKRQKPQLVFIGLHGAEGEDGRIQALLELNKIVFTGSGYKASALAMDKYLSGILVTAINIPVPEHEKINRKSSRQDSFFENCFPMVVKPNDSGSSVGIKIVSSKKELDAALKTVFELFEEVLCEQFIKGRELTVTVLDGKPLPVVEIKPKNGWYDYANKYSSGNTEYVVPALLSSKETKLVQSYAEQIFKIVGCEVYGRVDFRYDGEKFYFLEVNTLPGMTPLSLTPMAAKAAGLPFGDLLERLVDLSLAKDVRSIL